MTERIGRHEVLGPVSHKYYTIYIGFQKGQKADEFENSLFYDSVKICSY